MIVVDSSVWIDLLNGRNVPHVRRLRDILGTDEVIIGDLMPCEVLQGLDSERAARDGETLLRSNSTLNFTKVPKIMIPR
jgi:hypothetical protein